MKAPVLALLTIGQSPRPDMSDAIVEALPPNVRVIQAGVLDGLSPAQVSKRFALRENTFPLISKLSDGTVVELDERAVGEALQQCIDKLEDDGADVIVILCTGRFEHLRSRNAWLVEPDRVVLGMVQNLARGKRLGMVAPLPAQVGLIRQKWSGADDALPCAAASPYGSKDALAATALALRAQGAQAIVLDCMGYNQQHKQAITDAAPELPVFVSASVLASAVGNFF